MPEYLPGTRPSMWTRGERFVDDEAANQFFHYSRNARWRTIFNTQNKMRFKILLESYMPSNCFLVHDETGPPPPLNMLAGRDPVTGAPGWEHPNSDPVGDVLAVAQAMSDHPRDYVANPSQDGLNAWLATGETRVTNETTGGEKGSKIERYDLIPVEPLRQLAILYGRGAAKYADRNWEKGYDWHLSYAAAQRHLNLFWAGEDYDDETGVPHPINAIFHCMALVEWLTTHPELDNRPKPELAS